MLPSISDLSTVSLIFFVSDFSCSSQARREKISERMKILQDLVPGCNKVPLLSTSLLDLTPLIPSFIILNRIVCIDS